MTTQPIRLLQPGLTNKALLTQLMTIPEAKRGSDKNPADLGEFQDVQPYKNRIMEQKENIAEKQKIIEDKERLTESLESEIQQLRSDNRRLQKTACDWGG